MHKTDSTRTLHIYNRVSSSKQVKGLSLEMQQAAGIRRANELKYKYELYIETGKSASNDNTLNRPELQRLLALCSQGKVTDIFVTELDRFARKVDLIREVEETFKEHGIIIHAGHTPLDLRDPEQRFNVYFQVLLGERENVIKTKRSNRTMVEAMRRGKWQGILVPYGYRKNADKLIEVDEEEAQHYLFMVQRCLEGKGTNIIARELNERGVQTRGRKVLLNGTDVRDKFTDNIRHVSNEEFVWRPGTVCSILKNSIYKGVRKYKCDGEVHILPFPPIIDEFRWHQVQERLTKNKHYSSNERKHKYLLRGKLKCGRCGRNLYGRHKEKDSEFVYMCLSKRYQSCGLRSPNIFRLEYLVWDRIIKSDEHLRSLQQKWQQRNLSVEAEEVSKEIQGITRKIKDLENERVELADMCAKKDIDRELYVRLDRDKKARQEQLREKHTRLEMDLGLLRGKREAIDLALSNIDYIKEELDKFSWEEKHKIIDEIIESITVNWDSEANLHFIDIILKIDCVQYVGEILATPPGLDYNFEESRLLGQDKKPNPGDGVVVSPPPITSPRQKWYDEDF